MPKITSGKTKYLDWFVLTRKTVLMQRLGDLARTGHIYYIRGEVSPERAGYLAGKMDEQYSVGLTRLEQSRRRKQGFATFRLLILHQDGQEKLTWFVLRTEGKLPPPAEHEKWRNLLNDRIRLTGYELVRQTRPGSKNPAWTWRYEKEHEQALRDSLLRAIRTKRDDELRQLIHELWRTPGFAAARAQVKKFRQLIMAEWKRSRGTDPKPQIPERLGYVRRLPDTGRRLSEMGLKSVRKVRKNAPVLA
jgi:hypothetical protein